MPLIKKKRKRNKKNLFENNLKNENFNNFNLRKNYNVPDVKKFIKKTLKPIQLKNNNNFNNNFNKKINKSKIEIINKEKFSNSNFTN